MVGIGTANAVPAAQIVIAVIPIVGIVMGAVVVFLPSVETPADCPPDTGGHLQETGV